MVSQPPPSAPSETGSDQPSDQPMTGTGTTVPVADINRQAPDAPLSKRQQKMLKRKAEAEAAESGAGLGAGSNAKKAKGEPLSEKFPNESLAKLLDSWHIKAARGRDFPKIKQSKCILKGRECAILLRLRSTEVIKQGAPILVPAKMRSVLASQAPGLLIILQGGYLIKLSANHFTRNPSDGNGSSNDTGDLVDTHIFARESKILKDTIEKSHNIDLRDEDLSSINDVFSVATENLYLMKFGLKGRFWFERTPELPSNTDDLTETQMLQRNFAHSVLEQLNRGQNDAICLRAQEHVFPVVNAYWSNCLNLAYTYGDWSMYQHYTGKTVGKLFEKWYAEKGNPNLPIVRQRWMQTPQTSPKSMQYHSHRAQKNFSTPKELETVFSVALIGEAMWDNISIANHFSEDIIHTAIVGGKDIIGDRIFHILVSKSDEFPMPPTPPGSKLKVRFMPGVAEAITKPAVKNKGKGKQSGRSEDEDKTTPVADEPAVDSATVMVGTNAMEIENPTPAEASKNKNQAKGKGKGNKWQGQQSKAKQVKKEPASSEHSSRVIELADSPGDICIAVKIADKVLDASLIVGTEINVCLTVKRNPIPQIRQMRATASICKKPAVHNVKHAMLQNLLLGDDIYTGKDAPAQTVQEDHFSRMEDVERRAFNDFRDACNFNGPQEDFWQGIFGTDKFMSMLQGPPGTGKTTTVASVTLGFALLRVKTLLTAPSNTAAQECMRKLVGRLKALYEVCPESEEWFKVVYLPTESATRRDLSEQDDVDAETVSDMVADGEQPTEDEAFEKYKLWNYIVQAYKNDASDKTIHPADERRKNAHSWLSRRSQIKAGQNVGSKQEKIFIELTKAMTKKIFETSPIRIVVCTSSTSALLEEYKWTPWAVLIDEASAGSEPDSYVPLAFKPRRVVLAGDHEKIKLNNRSSGHNEFADQLGLSLYERFYGKPTMPLYRLTINYRMHPDIVELPANLTYEWLESDDSTLIPSDEFKFFEDWWHSEPAKIYRDNRRKPEFGLKIDESRIHRMFVNVRNGESAPKPGSQSQLNHANINAIADMVMSIMKHQPTCGLAPLPFDKISIFTPYKAENLELVNQVKMRIRHVWGDTVGRFPLFTTIDSTQGGQNEIILLSLTPANETNGSKIGFLKEWNRMNVALTRAQSTLFMFGNLDLWRSQLPVLVKGMRCNKLGLFIMDLLDYGDVIDIDGNNTLPASLEELPDRKSWSKIMISVPAANSKISKGFYGIKDEYEDKEKLAELEKSLWTENRKIREHGKAQREKFRRGETIEAPLRVQRDGGKECDKEDADSDDDDEALEVKDKDGDFDMDAN